MELAYHFFSVGVGSECYTIILYGEKEAAEKSLRNYFSRVTYLRTEYKERRDWHGNRRLDGSVIRACYFSGLFSPKRTRPLVEPSDALEDIA